MAYLTLASGVGLLNMVEVVPIIVIFVAENCFSVFFAVVPNRLVSDVLCRAFQRG